MKNESTLIFYKQYLGAVLADMQLFSKFNKGIPFYCLRLAFVFEYHWGIPLKDKKGITITSFFHKILNESAHKPNKI